jgi:hypothetical protein
LKDSISFIGEKPFIVITTVGRATLKMNVAPQKQNAICKTRAQNAIALLNYLKRIVPQQLMLRTQVFKIKLF